MKKTITLFVLLVTAFVAGAQNLISKVPAKASLVIKYSGDNLTNKVPVKKLDSYNFVKNNLFKALKIEGLTSLEGTGINFEQDAYQYVTMEDSSINFTSLFTLKDVQQFLKLVQENYHAEMKPVKKNGYEFLAVSDDVYIGWNDKQAALVFSSYQNKRYYYDNMYSDHTIAADTTIAMVDTVAPVLVDTAIQFTPPVIKKDKPAQQKKGAIKGKTKAKPAPKGKKGKKPAPKKVEEEVVGEEKIEEIVEAPKDYNYSYDTTGQAEREAKREAFEKEQNKYAAAVQNKIADSIINSFFNANSPSIETEISYKKVVDANANVSAWVNYDNLMYQYWRYVFGGYRYYSKPQNIIAPRSFGDNENKGFRSGINIFFDNDKMRLEQKMFAPDEATAAMGRDIYNSKQSNALAAYINPGNIGYLSASMNTEAMANYYYQVLRQYLNSSPDTRDEAPMMDVLIDFFEILIDEKGIADLMPGNMVFVLHDMKTKTVTYTDYTYDDNFKSTEVKKTKEELSPNFTFVMETRKDAFLKKIADLPLKYAEKEKFDYKHGYYVLAFDAEKYPISNLYFMVKDGKGIVTTNKEVIDMTMNNTGYNLDPATKNAVLNNNMSLRIDTKKLIQQINLQLTDESTKKISKYLEENMGDVQMYGGLKDGMIQSTTTMSINGNNANSLEFFFNMIEEINSIMEKDKEERNKKID
jgi:hypothetical protein